ncbi:MAG TPA: hypothetical protein VMF52_16565 [Steroidobacteraceae bacterium]|nr:hypothetical protein [Steroidobacteraceae bacterium]
MPLSSDNLVAYYSLSGNTERVARDIAARLGADLEQIRERASRRGFVGRCRAAIDSFRERPGRLEELARHAHDHALTIVGTPVWAGKMTPAIRAYLGQRRGQLDDVALFTTSGGSAGAAVIGAMERLIGQRAVASVAFDARELADGEAYEAKLRSFLAALMKRAPLPARASAR